MKCLVVVIHRQTAQEPLPGRLRAWVLQDGRRSDNLLRGRQFTNVDSAIEHVDEKLLGKFKLLDVPQIEYQVEDDSKTSKSQSAIDSRVSATRRGRPAKKKVNKNGVLGF